MYIYIYINIYVTYCRVSPVQTFVYICIYIHINVTCCRVWPAWTAVTSSSRVLSCNESSRVSTNVLFVLHYMYTSSQWHTYDGSHVRESCSAMSHLVLLLSIFSFRITRTQTDTNTHMTAVTSSRRVLSCNASSRVNILYTFCSCYIHTNTYMMAIMSTHAHTPIYMYVWRQSRAVRDSCLAMRHLVLLSLYIQFLLVYAHTLTHICRQSRVHMLAHTWRLSQTVCGVCATVSHLIFTSLCILCVPLTPFLFF